MKGILKEQNWENWEKMMEFMTLHKPALPSSSFGLGFLSLSSLSSM
jgi:hypothetical protein